MVVSLIALFACTISSCTPGRRLVSAYLGTEVAEEMWAGVYQVPGTREV